LEVVRQEEEWVAEHLEVEEVVVVVAAEDNIK
jgi:hypothetical protein